MGVLRQKCVPDYEYISSRKNISYESYLKEIANQSMFKNVSLKFCFLVFVGEIMWMNYGRLNKKNWNWIDNWYKEDDEYILCGNATGARKCPKNYICWKNRGMK